MVTILILCAAGLVFPALFFIAAPYGRHYRAGWGPTLPAKWAWVIMESPAALVFLSAWLASGRREPLLAALWLVHYGYRAYVFPWRARGVKPVLTVVMAIVFNTVNGWTNGEALGPQSGAHYVVGIALFVTGFAINLHSDAIVRKLRVTGYAIPQQGLHVLVAAPNYFGELVEWSGFAIAAWNLPALAFAVFTFANLAPRARSHLLWYRERFGADYPSGRRALIPWLW